MEYYIKVYILCCTDLIFSLIMCERDSEVPEYVSRLHSSVYVFSSFLLNPKRPLLLLLLF